jgi:hypothetical protein
MNKLIVVGFALACCEMNEIFVDVAVTLYFLQLSRRQESVEIHDVILTMAGP